jgi:hypothetical protein
MQSFGRPRRYVSAARLYAMFPVLRFSNERGAYVLRIVGETRGPVLRKDRRRRQVTFTGPDRREGGVDLLASRPVGGVRRIEVSKAAPGTTEATPHAQAGSRAPGATPHSADTGAATSRRRQNGRQRPPRPDR